MNDQGAGSLPGEETKRVKWLRLGFAVLMAALAVARAEDGYELWLRYRPEPEPVRRAEYATWTGGGVVAADRPVINAARMELERSLSAIRGASAGPGRDGRIFAGVRADHPALAQIVAAADLASLGNEGFVLHAGTWEGRPALAIVGASDVGVLRGAFAFIRRLQLGLPVAELNVADRPRVAWRIANHWDNPLPPPGTPSVERGYAGDSIFRWDELPGRVDPGLRDYARLLAAMGLNGTVINNVNTAKKGLQGWRLLTTEWLPKVVVIADLLRPYGVRVYLSVNFFSPKLLGGLATADPADPAVQAWWRSKVDEIYRAIPDFGGFLVKADSEGEPGPYRYGRTHAEGANLLAAALAGHGGVVFWRAFVYSHDADRAKDAYDDFRPLDGKFASNVFVQVKNGPLDFQVREPVSPLLGAMPRTNQALELEITQEYTGQATHVCYLAPQWSEVLAFDTHARGPGSTLTRLLTGKLYPETQDAMVGVMNLGASRNWTGHLLAQANTYAFGRLAWDPTASPAVIADEWVRLTFGRDPEVDSVVSRILLASWRAYENYTAPLGLNLLTAKGDHFTPDPAGRVEYHHADARGIGYDRTVATGSGYAGQYFEPWRSRYESVVACEEDLLLFFHHVPYDHRLKDGNTVIQEIYDRHFAGVEQARTFLREWDGLRGRIDEGRFTAVRARLVAQIRYAEEWCRVVNGYFEKLSGVPDAHHRKQP